MSLKISIFDDAGTWFDITDEVTNLDSLTETLGLDTQSSTVTFSTSSEFEVRGKVDGRAYEIIRKKYFDCSAGSCSKPPIPIRIEIGCCNSRIREFVTDSTLVQWCVTGCYFTVNLMIESEVLRCYDQLKKTYFWAESTGWVQQLDVSQVYRFPDESAVTNTVGASYLHAYKPLEILRYHLDNFGIDFISDFETMPIYSDVTFGFSAQIPPSYPAILWNDDFLPEITILQLAELYASLVNAEIRMTYENGKCRLYLQRKDYFNTPIRTIPISHFQTEKDICVRYKQSETTNCASTVFKYAINGIEGFRNEANFKYYLFKDWDESQERTEKCEVILSLHAPLFADNGALKDDFNLASLTLGTPVVVVWDGVSPKSDARPIRSTATSTDWNYPVFFGGQNGLFENFFFLEDPDRSGCVLELTDDLELFPDNVNITFCELLDILDEVGVMLGFSFTDGDCTYTILSQDIKIDYNRKTITIQDTILTT